MQQTELQAKKFTKWEREPTLSELQNDLRLTIPSQQSQMAKIDAWNEAHEAKKPALGKGVKNRSTVQPKLIRKINEWRYPGLSEPFLSSAKLFNVEPVTFEDTEAAKQNEILLNYQFRNKINRVRLIDNMVRSFVDDGTVIVRLGWKRKTATIKEEVLVYAFYPVENEEQVQALQQALELEKSNPRAFSETTPDELKQAVSYYHESGEPVYAVVTGSTVQPVEKIIENCPEVEVVNPRNVYIDPSCGGDIDKAMFIITGREVNRADMQKEIAKYGGKISEKEWEQLPTAATDAEFTSSTPVGFEFKDSSRKRVVLYEYWGFYDTDGSGDLKPILAAWIGNKLLFVGESPFSSGRLPFEWAVYSPIKWELYGLSDSDVLIDNQAIQGAVTRGVIDLLGRSANSQRGIAKNMLDPLNKRRYEAGQDYEFNPNTSPNAGIVEHRYPEIPNSALTMLTLQEQYAEAMTGIKSFNTGVSGNSYGNVATGIKGALDATGERKMAILRRLAQLIIRIGKQLIAMNAEFLSEDEVVRVTNAEFVTIRPEDLAGNFDLDIDISTTEVDNAKVQDLAFLMQTLGNTVDSSVTLILLAEIARLKRMPELENKLRNYQAPPPSEEQQKMQQLEMAKLEAEIANLQAEAQLRMSQSRVHGSNADLKDLEYVEEESGTKHARELEKQKAQARGNQNLQISKALTKGKKPDEADIDVTAAIGFNDLVDKGLV